MWGRGRDKDDIALSTIEIGRREKEEHVVEYDFKPVQWKDFVTKKKYIPWWLIGIITLTLGILITVYHDQIVEVLRPISEKLREVPAGWLLPILILVIISFPPLFGHELVAFLCGVVYGLGIGFAIVAAGTFIGEVGTWYAFKKLFRQKAIKLERTNLNYGAMARLTRDGGFWVILLIRLSIIPSHLSTAVFSTCDVKFWHFAVATFLTLPKQIILVYVGVLLVQTDKETNAVSTTVLFLTVAVTAFAAIYIYIKMSRVKKVLLNEQEMRKMERESLASRKNSHSTTSSQDSTLPKRRDGLRTPSPQRQSDDFLATPPDAHWQEGYKSEQRPKAAPQEFL